ncbi:MAG TPA: penicillin-binding transpeptidase domain-containing protein [Pirellulales bacterium]|nr:penicillin-binding transpeptidase domain-containing protein [Pirellulales bacterium]
MGARRDFDWRRLAASDEAQAPGGDSRGRLRWVLAMIAGCAAIVMARVAALETFYGESYRAKAARPIRRVEPVPAPRGRILARDGTVLAYDRQLSALAVHYRYLEQPSDARWLELQARRRLLQSERRDRAKLDAECQRLLAERDAMHLRLAALCGRTPEGFRARAAEIQRRVERIAASVNERRRRLHDERQANSGSVRQSASPESEGRLARAARWLVSLLVVPQDEAPYSPIAVAEELEDHVVFEDVPLEAVAEIAAHPQRYPGVRIVERRRRIYPAGSLAAHVLGHLGPNGDGGWAGQLGVERQFESLLRGRDGLSVELTNRSGQTLSTEREREPLAGRDLTLSIDSDLQRTAEMLLDQTLVRSARQAGQESGGAIVVMNVATGAVLASASAPRFDPGAFAARDPTALRDLLAHPAHPLFDRASRMAIPPGSTFKALSAIALLESGATTPDEAFYCQGFLHQPTRQRCPIYRRHRRGHERVTLCDALAQSCNVYFFHYAEQAGPEPLVAWAEAFGFGAATGIDLPDESPGQLPMPAAIRAPGRAWREGDTLSLAIGQGSLTATPLQIARLFAAIANGGRLVTPRIALRLAAAADEAEPGAKFDDEASQLQRASPQAISGLHPETLAAVRRGLEQVVADPSGTGHRTVYNENVSIAGKTGTAETGGGREDHAWFAGYAPAESPVVAFAIALEHAGSGAEAAGPIAKRLVQKLDSLGYFRRVQANKASRKREFGEPQALGEPEASASASRRGREVSR